MFELDVDVQYIRYTALEGISVGSNVYVLVLACPHSGLVVLPSPDIKVKFSVQNEMFSTARCAQNEHCSVLMESIGIYLDRFHVPSPVCTLPDVSTNPLVVMSRFVLTSKASNPSFKSDTS